MPHVRLHRLLGEEEALADLAIYETVCDELKYLQLAGRWILVQLTQGRRIERDNRA
jgi:hypothetical protein